MKIETQLFDECELRDFNCSLTYQGINGFSVEIYKGYKQSYQQIFYTDGHLEKSIAIKKALKFIRTSHYYYA